MIKEEIQTLFAEICNLKDKEMRDNAVKEGRDMVEVIRTKDLFDFIYELRKSNDMWKYDADELFCRMENIIEDKIR